MAKNPEYSPFGPIRYGDEMGIGGGAAVETRIKKAEREIRPQGEKTGTLLPKTDRFFEKKLN